MPAFDLVHHIVEVQAFGPAARTATVNSATIDTSGYNSLALVLSVGTVTDGTHAFQVQGSDDGATWVNSPATDLIGGVGFTNLASGAGNGSNSVQEVGYIGNHRYVRVVDTVTGATTGGVYELMAILGNPRRQPAGVAMP